MHGTSVWPPRKANHGRQTGGDTSTLEIPHQQSFPLLPHFPIVKAAWDLEGYQLQTAQLHRQKEFQEKLHFSGLEKTMGTLNALRNVGLCTFCLCFSSFHSIWSILQKFLPGDKSDSGDSGCFPSHLKSWFTKKVALNTLLLLLSVFLVVTWAWSQSKCPAVWRN